MHRSNDRKWPLSDGRSTTLFGKNWRRQATLAAVYAQQGEISKATVAKAAALKLEPRLTIAYLKGLPQRGSQAYLDLLDMHYYAGLRKAGFPEQ